MLSTHNACTDFALTGTIVLQPEVPLAGNRRQACPKSNVQGTPEAAATVQNELQAQRHQSELQSSHAYC